MIEESKKLALNIGKIIDEKKGQDIIILDIHQLSSFADYFVIASGTSIRQVKAIADEIEDRLQKNNIFINHKEGYESGTWVLMDYNSIIVHLFTEEQRSFYNIERLWRDAYQLTIDI